MQQLFAWLATAFPASVIRMRWVVLAVAAAIAVWIIPGVAQVREDNDVLAFLPPDHAEVVAFHEIAGEFGVLEVGLVGLTPSAGDMLAAERIEDVRILGKQLGERAGVRIVLSYTDLPHPEIKGDGLEVAPLVPKTMTDEAAIRARVLGSKDAVGNFISADGKAAALLIFLIHETGEDRVALRTERLIDLRATVESWATDRGWDGEIHYGGAPFIEDAAARSSRTDIERLSPIVIGVLVLVSGLLLRSLTAAILNVLVTGLGVALIMGAHGTFGEALTIVSSSIPVMMVALGGAFGVHVLAGYQRQPDTLASGERVAATLRELQVPVLISGLTTAVAFFALFVMPQVPMKRFGVAAGIGVLVLLALALCVMPALLAVLPKGWIKARPEQPLPLRLQPPAWVLALLAALGLALSFGLLRADPDTSNVFAENSEPRRANVFFNEHFGGSTFLQVAVEGDIREPAVLRRIRNIEAEVQTIEGVVGVQSVVNPVSVLNAALGGRHGIPETPGRSQRVFALLEGHPAMAQLMTQEGSGALLHIKLAPVDGDRQVEITEQVRGIVERSGQGGALIVAPTSVESVREQQVAELGRVLGVVLGREVDTGQLLDVFADPSPALLAEVTKVRDMALNSDDSPVDPAHVAAAEVAALDPKRLIKARGAELEKLLRETQPTLQQNDAEGIKFVAEHLGPWVDEALQKFVVEQRCAVLGLETPPPAGAENKQAAEADPRSCARVLDILGELEDKEWGIGAATKPEGVELRELRYRARLTGQPVIGAAFAESVTSSLIKSTLVSLVGLALVLVLARQLLALIPALWTLIVTLGVLGVLGLPVSVGTSMVACIALGAGVDFAIHLGIRARRIGGAGSGERAVDEIGVVGMISALQLAFAFLVLLASGMAPLRDFGAGLAIGLVGAALGACWLVPSLHRGR